MTTSLPPLKSFEAFRDWIDGHCPHGAFRCGECLYAAFRALATDIDRLLELTSMPDHIWEGTDYADRNAIHARYAARAAEVREGE